MNVLIVKVGARFLTINEFSNCLQNHRFGQTLFILRIKNTDSIGYERF